jgi:Lon protease-like protein
MERLPLFPLRVVLIPHNTLPLHVFEERYRLMIGRCLDEQSPFGVVLIRSGEEVGGPAEPYDVGTVARISRVQRLPDGRMNLLVFGERRCRILALDSSEPYLQGDVEPLASIGGATPEAAAAARQVAERYAEHFRLSMAVTDQWMRDLDLPSDPDVIADFVAGHIDVDADTRQELLETLSVPERLHRELDLLDGCIRELTDRWEERQRRKFAGGVLN